MAMKGGQVEPHEPPLPCFFQLWGFSALTFSAGPPKEKRGRRTGWNRPREKGGELSGAAAAQTSFVLCSERDEWARKGFSLFLSRHRGSHQGSD